LSAARRSKRAHVLASVLRSVAKEAERASETGFLSEDFVSDEMSQEHRSVVRLWPRWTFERRPVFSWPEGGREDPR
jgi:hypothetical protein